MDRVYLKISGRVQGVFFRANTQAKAVELGITGWVRNSEDGSVEVTAEGEKNILEKLISWCQVGPPAGKVTKVEVVWEKATGEFKSFSIRY